MTTSPARALGAPPDQRRRAPDAPPDQHRLFDPPIHRMRAMVVLASIVSLVAVLGLSPVNITSPAGSAGLTEIGVAASFDDLAERIADPASPSPVSPSPVSPSPVSPGPVPSAEPPTTAPANARVAIVADPRPGDTLPAGWSPTAGSEVRDLAYGPDPLHRYDLHLPVLPDRPADAPSLPVIVFLHSGGWVEGDRSVVPDMVLRFLDHGYAVASIDYRLAPDTVFPGPVEDVKRAVREIKAMGFETGLVDPDRVIVYGTSAGGHLAALAAATVGRFEPTDLTPTAAAFDSSVAGVVSIVGPTDLVQMHAHPNAWAAPMSGTFMGCFPECTDDQLRPANPAEYLHPDVPPAYWAYGAHDPLVDADAQGRAIARAWADAGGASWLDIVDDGDHNLDGTLVNQRAIELFVGAALENVNDR